MIEIIAQIILVGSIIGMGVILFQKIPVLAELPEVFPKKRGKIFPNIKKKIKNFGLVKSFSSEIFLQKLLSRIRILSLKTDNKISSWLQKLREESQRRKEKESDNYWEELKKSTNQGAKKKKRKKPGRSSSVVRASVL